MSIIKLSFKKISFYKKLNQNQDLRNPERK